MRIQKKLIITTSYFTIGVLGMYASLYQFTLLSFSQLFGLNSAMLGLFVAIQFIAISLPPLYLGLLSAKIGKKKVLMISYGLIAAGTLLVGIISNLYLFMASIFVIGAGFSVLEGTHCAVLADEFPDESNKHINFSQVFFSIGALISPFIAERLINSGIFFKDLYIYISIVFLITALAFIFVRFSNDKGEHHPQQSIFSAFVHFKKKTFLFLAIAIFLYVGAETTIASFTDSYFNLALNQPQSSALALSLFWGAMIPSRFLAGFLKVDTKKALVILGALVIAASAGAMLVPGSTAKIILFALCGFGCGPIWPFIMDTTASKFKGASAPSLNIMMSFCGLGGAVIPLLSGIIITCTDETAPYYFSAMMMVLMLGFYIGSVRNGKSISNRNGNSIGRLP